MLLGVQKKSRFKNKSFVACLFVFLGGHFASRADDTVALSPIRALPQESCSPRSWCSPVPPWLGQRRAPVSRTCHTSTHARFLLLAVVMVLLLYLLRLVGSGTATTTTAAYSLVLSPHHHL